MTAKTPTNVTPIEDIATARWLAQALAQARATVESGPSAEAVARIRSRIFGRQQKRADKLAA